MKQFLPTSTVDAEQHTERSPGLHPLLPYFVTVCRAARASCSLPPLCLQDRVTVGKMEREPEALQAATAAREAELLARQRAAAAAEQRRRRERRAARCFSSRCPAARVAAAIVAGVPCARTSLVARPVPANSNLPSPCLLAPLLSPSWLQVGSGR